MKSIAVMIVLLSCCLIEAVASAGDLREIELKDGSVISGEIVSAGGGVYTVASPTLGTIRIEESKIRAIRAKESSNTPGAQGPGAAAAADTAGRTKSLQERMMNDKEIMNMIQSLQNDPDFQKILQDPATMKAVQSGDLASLMANPEFMKLLNNRTVQDIKNKVAR